MIQISHRKRYLLHLIASSKRSMNSFLWLFSRGGHLVAFFSRRRPLPTTENAEKLLQFSLHTPPLTKKIGITGVARLHNSAPFLELVIMSWIEVFDEILLIDNASTDTTLQICQHLRDRYPQKIRVLSYPFPLAPAHSEDHIATDPTSVHSLVYFYRRCFDQASYQLVSKIDDDNLLIHTRADPLQLRHQVLSLSPQTYLTYSGYNISYDTSTDRYMLLDIPHRYS